MDGMTTLGPSPPTRVTRLRLLARTCIGLVRRGRSLFPLREVVFVAAFAAFLHLCVDVRLVFWNQNDLFLWNTRFARDFLVAPGRPCAWLGKLLLQTCHFGWPGAAAIALTGGVVIACGRGFLARIGSGAAGRAWPVPAALLVVLHSQYAFGLAATVGLAVAMAGANMYARVPIQNGWARFAIFAAGSLILGYMADEACYVLAACCLLYEWFVSKRRILGLSFLLTAFLVEIALKNSLAHLNAAHWFVDPPESSSQIPPRAAELWFLAALCAWYPACALFFAAGPTVLGAVRRLSRKARAATVEAAPTSPGWMRRAVRPLLAAVLLVVSGAGGWKWAEEPRAALRIDLCSSRRMWPEVVQTVRNVPARVPADYVNYDLNTALYHTGRLPYDMFAFPQSRLLVDASFGERGPLLARKAFDLLLDLGRVNEAETVAHDSLEHRLSAEFLKRAAIVKRIKGQTAAARIYLNVLCDDAVYGRWAEAERDRLDQEPDLSAPEITAARRRMVAKDDAFLTHGEVRNRLTSISVEQQLISLLEQDPGNRMAFEYLMANHLLKRDLDAAVALLPRAKAFYERLPLLYEEAAMLYAGRHPDQLVVTDGGASVCGCPISAWTTKRFQVLFQIDRSCRGLNNAGAQAAVASELGPTYVSYYFYGPERTR